MPRSCAVRTKRLVGVCLSGGFGHCSLVLSVLLGSGAGIVRGLGSLRSGGLRGTQFPPQDLAAGRARHARGELQLPDLLVRGHLPGDVRDSTSSEYPRPGSGCRTTYALGTSLPSSSVTPMTAASATASCVSRTASSSAGATW